MGAWHGRYGKGSACSLKEIKREDAWLRASQGTPYERTAAYRQARDAWQANNPQCRVPGFCHTVGECGCIPVETLVRLAAAAGPVELVDTNDHLMANMGA